VRVGTRFGDLWSARMLLLGVVAGGYGLCLFYREEQPEIIRPTWTASAWAMALMVGTFSAGSHAAGSLLWPWIGVTADWLHILAVGFWAGGLGALVLLLPPALAPLEGESRRRALLAVLGRFSRLATACLAIVITTGIYSALNWLYTPGDVTGTTYGSALILKLLLVGGLLLVGLAHYIALHPERYRQWNMIVARVGDFIPTLRLEALLALVVAGSVGYLSATPVPPPQLTQAASPPLSETQTVGDLSVTMTITPGVPGGNTYDTLVTRDGQPVDGLTVRVQIAHPARDKRGVWLAGEDAETGLYVAAGGEIDQGGEWWSLADITLPDGTTRRAAFDWTVNPDAAVIPARSPSALNILALVGVLVAVGWVISPWAGQVYRRLDLRPAVVTVAIGATLAAALFTILGVSLIQASQEQYDATVNPPPKVVNTVLPDAASLERGQALFDEACASWTDASDLKTLLDPRTRDEALFAATRDGWRALPACESMPDLRRWDVVNFLRVTGNE
jgi:putative copper export protein